MESHTDKMLRVRALQNAMDMKFDSTLPAKTLAEQEAGRARIMVHLRQSIVDIGIDELQRRFTKKSVATGGLRFVKQDNRWMVDVVVHTAAGTTMQMQDDLMDFPSDQLITDVALVS